MKIIFAGTPAFAVPSLTALLQSKHQICAVYTQPDRPAGRGQKLTASPIKEIALTHHLPIFQPVSLRDATEQQRLRELQADIMVVVAYGLLLPKTVLEIPAYGCINVHPSLLPRWRGATPIQSAILAGDKETGVTIMQMDEGMDTGPMIKKITYPLSANITSGELHDQLAKIGADLLLKVLDELEAGTAVLQAQDNTHATYTKKIFKEDAELNWQLTAIELDRKIRAFNPWPVAFTEFEKNPIRIWRAVPLAQKISVPPGEIVMIDKSGMDVATGDGILRILELQLSGGKKMTVQDFLNARKNFFVKGAKLG